MGRTEAMVFQYLYCPGIIYSIWKEVPNCDTCPHTKQSNIKYGKLAANLTEEIPWNTVCVDLIWPYVIRIKVQKENLHIKAITILDTVTRWFEIIQYNNMRVISTADLVEIMWLSLYPRPMEITYDQGSEFISHEFRKSPVEK